MPVLQEVAAEGMIDHLLDVIFVQDAARLAVGVEHRKERLTGIKPEQIEHGFEFVAFAHRRQLFDLLADQNAVERRRRAVTAAIQGQMRIGRLQIRLRCVVGRAMK